MGRAIVIGSTILILGLFAVLLVVWLSKLGHRERAAEKGWAVKGDLNKKQEQELQQALDSAAEIFEALTGLDGRWDDMSFLKDKHRDRVTAWLQKNNQRRIK